MGVHRPEHDTRGHGAEEVVGERGNAVTYEVELALQPVEVLICVRELANGGRRLEGIREIFGDLVNRPCLVTNIGAEALESMKESLIRFRVPRRPTDVRGVVEKGKAKGRGVHQQRSGRDVGRWAGGPVGRAEGRCGPGAIKLHLIVARVEAQLIHAELLEADKGLVGHVRRANQVAIVEVGEDMELGELPLELAEDGMESCCKEPRAVGVALADTLRRGYVTGGHRGVRRPSAGGAGALNRGSAGQQGRGADVLPLSRRQKSRESGVGFDSLHDFGALDGVETIP